MGDAEINRIAAMPALKFQQIEFGSDAFRMECELRNEVLRLPIGMDLYDEDISRESRQLHFGLFDQANNLLACVVVDPCSPTEAKIRQMAVKSECRGQGYGSSMIRYLEDHLARRGITHLFMHARMTAVEFYEKLGYGKVGNEFTEVGIPHIKMEKHMQLSIGL